MKPYEIIKKRRIELGLSQSSLGKKLGYTQQAIQLIESGGAQIVPPKGGKDG